MSKGKKNRKAVVVGILLGVLILGICFGSVTLYARNEINKPKFHIPESDEPTLLDRLTDKNDAFTYAMQLYTAAIEADDTEGSWKTDVRKLDNDWQTPFSKADEAIFSSIRKNAGSQLSSLYPKADNVRLRDTTEIPQIDKQAEDVLDFSVMIGRENDKKEIVDTDRYFLTLTFDPQSENVKAITDSEIFRNIVKELSPVVTLSDTQIDAESITACFEIEVINEKLLSVEIKRDLQICTTVRAVDSAETLLAEREGRIVMPYGTTQKISFLHYGAHFTEHAIAVEPKDVKALPAKVSINKEATKADYTLTFSASDPESLSFDTDGVMTVGKNTVDEPVIVTMTLEYEGHTYTDTLTVYVTEWEVEADAS